MIVNKELQILAYHEHMEQLFVDNLEILNGTIFPRIVHGELELLGLIGLHRSRIQRQVHVELHRFRNAFAQLHAAASASARLIGTDIGVHGANENFVLRPQADPAGRRRGRDEPLNVIRWNPSEFITCNPTGNGSNELSGAHSSLELSGARQIEIKSEGFTRFQYDEQIVFAVFALALVRSEGARAGAHAPDPA